MANITIPNLPAAIALDGTEMMEAVQSRTSVRVTTRQIAALGSGSVTSGANLPPVGSFGFVDPTGAADSFPGFQAAINSGYSFFVPPGTYKIGTGLTVSTYASCGQTIYGAGSYYADGSSGATAVPPGTTVLVPGASVTALFIVDGTPIGGVATTWVQGFGIENLAIDMTNMSDVSTNSAIVQIQAFDCFYKGVRVKNYGVNKLSWWFKTGAFTTTLQNCQGSAIKCTGTALNNAVTTIAVNNGDFQKFNASYHQNITFSGGAVQGPYNAANIIYLPPGTTPYAYIQNVTGLYAVVLSDISNALQFTSMGCDWERGGGSFPSTYNDGTHGTLNLVSVCRVQSTCTNTTFINPTFAGMYLLDYGVNTRLIGQGLSGVTGIDIHTGVALESSSLGIGATLFGFTNLAQWVTYGTGTTFSVDATTGTATFQSLVIRPVSDGASTIFENAVGTSIGYVGTGPSPTINISGILQGYQIKSQPAVDGTAVTLLNAAGTPLLFATTNATPANSQWNYANGILLQGHSDNFVTVKWSINSATGAFNTVATYSVSGVQVVAARQTGWTAPTGTLSRATFDQSTVTLPQLAQRLAALITDLTTHGLIGP